MTFDQLPDTRPIRTQPDLDAALGGSIQGEDEAWTNYNALKAERKTPGTIPADRLPAMRTQLASYVKQARAYNRPLFSSQTNDLRIKQNAHTNALLEGTGDDSLKKALAPDQFAALTQRAKLAPDPEAYKARAINAQILATAYGSPIKPDMLDTARNHYAKTVLKMSGDTSDKAVYSELQKRKGTMKFADELVSKASEQYFQDTAAGSVKPFEEYTAVLSAIPDDDLREQATNELRLTRRRITSLNQSVAPIASALFNYVVKDAGRADAVQIDTAVNYIGSEIEAANRFMKLSSEQQAAVMGIIAARTKNMPPDPRTGMQRAGSAMGEQTTDMLKGFSNFYNSVDAQLTARLETLLDKATGKFEEPGSMTPPPERSTLRKAIDLTGLNDPMTAREQDFDKLIRARTSIKNMGQAAKNPVKPSDHWTLKSFILGAQTLPYMVTASSGVGTALTAASMAGDSYAQARTQNPEAKARIQLGAAAVSGSAQAVIERASVKSFTSAIKGNNALIKFLTGKYGAESALRLAGVTSALGRGAAAGVAGILTTTAVEYGEEVAQDFTDRGLQDLAIVLSDQDPTTDYGALLKSWAPTGEKGTDTILALLPYALIGGAGASFAHFRNGTQLQHNAAALRAVGVNEESIQKIIRSPDIQTADQQMKEAFDAGLEIKGREEMEVYQEAMRMHIANVQALSEATGTKLITQLDDPESPTGESYELRLPGQEAQTFDNEQDAHNAFADYYEQERLADQTSIEQGLVDGIIGMMKEDYQANEQVVVRKKDQIGSMANLMKSGAITMAEATARLEIYALEQGMTMPELNQQIALGNGPIVRARAFAEQVNAKSRRYVVELFNGADPLNATEDFSESYWQKALYEGLINPLHAAGWLHDLGKATGYQYLAGDFTYAPEMQDSASLTPEQNEARRVNARSAAHMQLIEGLSKASIQYMLGNLDHQNIPTGLQAWIERMAAIVGKAWTWARQLAASKEMKAAIKDGKLKRDFVTHLADSVGLNESMREKRAMQAQTEEHKAAFVDENYKLSEVVKGKLLHPETARATDNPAAGELQNIYDGLLTYAKKKNKSDYTAYHIKATEFFARKGEMVKLDDLRGTLEELGFTGMDTVSDMLEKINDVISTEGMEYYSTNSGINQSFSLGRATITPVANTQIFQGAEGSPTVIGPVSFSLGDYRIQHQPHPENAQISDLAEMFGDDIYGPNAIRYFGVGQQGEREAVAIFKRVKDKPEEPVTIYRVVPNFVKEINPGDWVTISKAAAETMNTPEFLMVDKQGKPQQPHIISKIVKAGEVRWPGDSLLEQGYFPDGPVSFSLSAHHGTPHKVDKFSTAYMGTGEGAQAYGWGLYFAGSKEVADGYRETLSNKWDKITIDGKPLADQQSDEANAIRAYKRTGGNFLKWKKDTAARMRSAAINGPGQGRPERAAELQNAAKVIESLKASDLKNNGNLYTVTLDVNDDELLDWDKPLKEQTTKVKSAIEKLVSEIKKAGIEELYKDLLDATEMIGMDGGFFYKMAQQSGGPKNLSKDLSNAGIPGIRFLDGNSRDGGKGTYNYVMFDDSLITITEENGKAVDMKAEGQSFSFSLSRPQTGALEEIIAARMNAGPDERAKIYENMRTRLLAHLYKLERRTATDLSDIEEALYGWKTNPDMTDAERERLRIEDALDAVKALVSAAPGEIRAEITVPLTRILNANTERKTVNAFAELIENIDEVIEKHLRKEYREAIENILEMSTPAMNESRQRKGKLTPETQILIDQIEAVTYLNAEELASARSLISITISGSTDGQVIGLIEKIDEADTTEERDQLEAKLADATTQSQFLHYFGLMEEADTKTLAEAKATITRIYKTGRYARKLIDEEDRKEAQGMRQDVLNSLEFPNGPSQPEYSRATDKKSTAKAREIAKNAAFDLFDIHTLLETVFPYSRFGADISRRLILAMRGTYRRRRAVHEKFNAFLVSLGYTTKRKQNAFLASISERKSLPVEIAEPLKGAWKKEKLTIEQAEKIVSGTMKVDWYNYDNEDNRLASDDLLNRLTQWRQLPKRRKAAQKFIEITRVTGRKAPVALHLSQTEIIYWLQLAAQSEYGSTLNNYGITPAVVEKLKNQLTPEAAAIMRYMRESYDENHGDMNQVFMELYNMHMPSIRNYAPGSFESRSAAPNTSGDPMGGDTAMSAMNIGATKNRRAHNARPRQVSALNMFFGHHDKTTYWIEYATIARDLRAILMTPDIRRAIETAHGTGILQQIKGWIDTIDKDGANDMTARLETDNIMQGIMSAQSTMALTWNLGVPFKQMSAALGSMWFIRPSVALPSFFKAITSPATMRKVWKSEAIQSRIFDGFSPEDKELMKSNGLQGNSIFRDLSALNRAGRLPMSYADAFFTTISGSIAYEYHYAQAIKEGSSPAQAEANALSYMDTVVARSSQPNNTQFKSLLEINAKGAAKMLFMFKSDPRKQLALLLSRAYLASKGKYSKEQLAEEFAVQWIAYGILFQLGTSVFQSFVRPNNPDNDDLDEIWNWKNFAAAAAVGPIEGFSFIGGLLSGAMKKLLGSKVYSNSVNPLNDIVAKAMAKMTAKEFSLDTQTILTTMGGLAAPLDKGHVFSAIPAAWKGVSQIGKFLDGLHTSDAEEIENANDAIKATVRESLTVQTQNYETQADDIEAMPAAEQQAAIDALDKEAKAKVMSILKKREQDSLDMTPTEKEISKLGKTARAERINAIIGKLSPNAAEEFKLRMRELNLME